jgi:hypothetical protein
MKIWAYHNLGLRFPTKGGIFASQVAQMFISSWVYLRVPSGAALTWFGWARWRVEPGPGSNCFIQALPMPPWESVRPWSRVWSIPLSTQSYIYIHIIHIYIYYVFIHTYTLIYIWGLRGLDHIWRFFLVVCSSNSWSLLNSSALSFRGLRLQEDPGCNRP